jgi:hypothetical protein
VRRNPRTPSIGKRRFFGLLLLTNFLALILGAGLGWVDWEFSFDGIFSKIESFAESFQDGVLVRKFEIFIFDKFELISFSRYYLGKKIMTGEDSLEMNEWELLPSVEGSVFKFNWSQRFCLFLSFSLVVHFRRYCIETHFTFIVSSSQSHEFQQFDRDAGIFRFFLLIPSLQNFLLFSD